jgi:uncharacterized OB-fold protein
VTSVSDSEVFERFAPPAWIDRDNIDFLRGFLEHRLLINKCGNCGTWSQPPYPVCPSCQSLDVHPTEVSGRGVIFTFTILHTGGTPGVDYKPGHPVAVIDLEEQDGLRATGTIVNCAHEDIRIGMPVELTWIERNGADIPAWQPAST